MPANSNSSLLQQHKLYTEIDGGKTITINGKIGTTNFSSVSIDAFIAGKLSLLDETHAGFHGHGGN